MIYLEIKCNVFVHYYVNTKKVNLSLIAVGNHSKCLFRLVFKTGEYKLTLRATDFGSPALSSCVYVIATVLDVNDNPPRPAQANYTLFVQVCSTTVIGMNNEQKSNNMSFVISRNGICKWRSTALACNLLLH